MHMPPAFHGTTAKHLPNIIKEGGLLSRACNQNADSNWEEHPSANDRIYFSDCYAPYYAMAVTDRPYKWLLCEAPWNGYGDSLNLPEFYRTKLIPDEDWLEQADRAGMIKLDGKKRLLEGDTLQERTEHAKERAKAYAGWWAESMRMLGTCAFQWPRLEPDAYYLFDPWDKVDQIVTQDLGSFGRDSPKALSNFNLAFGFIDPSINLMNHAIMGEWYQRVTLEVITRSVRVDECLVRNRHLDAMKELSISKQGQEQEMKGRQGTASGVHGQTEETEASTTPPS